MPFNGTLVYQMIQRYIPLSVWIICILTLLLIPLKIREYGYAPSDDAHRHIAKAISGKPWNEILVMRDDVTIDTNFGWHTILRFFHTVLKWDAESLMTFSIVGLFLVMGLTGLIVSRRPESWLMALLIIQIPYMDLIGRLTRGRPYIVSIAVLIALLSMWRSNRVTTRIWIKVAVTTILITCAVWIHGSWYLWGLLVGAYFLSGRFRESLLIGISWLVGSVIGACLTGDPTGFLWEQLRWAFDAFGRHEVQRVLVTEFQPSIGDPIIIVAIVIMLIWIRIRENGINRIFHNPGFVLIVIGWTFGLATKRFWLDWGIPAAIAWLMFEIRSIMNEDVDRDDFKRLGITCFVALAFFFATTSDISGRWTNQLMTEYFDADDPELAGWLPDDGGILYNPNMGDFYHTFYANPHANWRYVLGYEPAIMKEDDLEIYRDIQWNYGAPESFEPWVNKMALADRLLISGGPSAPPKVPILEWKYVGVNRWSGRLPTPRPLNRE